MRVVATDHKQTSNLTSWLFVFLSNEFFTFVNDKTIIFFDLLLFRKFTFLFHPRHPLYILVPGKRLVFYFDCVMYTFTYIYIYIHIYIYIYIYKCKCQFIPSEAANEDSL